MYIHYFLIFTSDAFQSQLLLHVFTLSVTLIHFFFQTKFQSLMYQNVLAAQYRNSLANELMMYHMKVTR